MASYDGIAFLDLDGNRVQWNTAKTNKILLKGGSFRDVVPLTTLVVSALCLLCFITILIARCCARSQEKEYRLAEEKPRKLLHKTVTHGICCMILFFSADLVNRVFHCLQKTVRSPYLAIDVVREVFASSADGLILTYLLKWSPIMTTGAGRLGVAAKLLILAVIVVYWCLGVTTWGVHAATLYYDIVPVVVGIDPERNQDLGNSANILTLKLYKGIGSAASGMPVLGALGFAGLCMAIIKKTAAASSSPNTITPPLPKAMRNAILALGAGWLLRSAVVFCFALVYVQYNHTASLGVQLLYLALYGGLTAVVYSCIVYVVPHWSKVKALCDPPFPASGSTLPMLSNTGSRVDVSEVHVTGGHKSSDSHSNRPYGQAETDPFNQPYPRSYEHQYYSGRTY